ncbi:class I SAM-dependent methyltransferase [Candidatus Micrarchaeota archaeon]|nr:class I SAM-dependent methyltransferase [Candidatus Micrarchaeota archaeon]
MAEKTKATRKKGHLKPDFSSASSAASHWDSAYRLPSSEIPWEIEQPPSELVALLDSGRVNAGSTALDVACGSGNYSVFLAKKGFDVTGVDFSEKALALAEKKAQKAGVRIDFVKADVRHLLSALNGKKFDFILDWSLLHHVAPVDLDAYAAQFGKLLSPGGVLLLACFSDADAPKAGQSEAVGKMGNVMYYRTRNEIEAAYRPLKAADYRECRLGKKQQHAGHCFVFQRQ